MKEKDENRLIEIMAEMLIKHDEMVANQIQTNKELVLLRNEFHSEIGSVKNEMSKLNLLSAENNRAIMKLANQMEQFLDLHPRVEKLEKAVFK